jgi:hypothetical protein
LRGNQALKTCTPESKGWDKPGIGFHQTAHAFARFAAAVPARGFGQGRDSGRQIKSPWRGVQRVGFLAKWAFWGFLRVWAGFLDFEPSRGRGANIAPRPPSCDTGRKIHTPLLRKKRKKVKKQQVDRDSGIENSTRGPNLRA